jgi:hypothetical protein
MVHETYALPMIFLVAGSHLPSERLLQRRAQPPNLRVE